MNSQSFAEGFFIFSQFMLRVSARSAGFYSFYPAELAEFRRRVYLFFLEISSACFCAVCGLFTLFIPLNSQSFAEGFIYFFSKYLLRVSARSAGFYSFYPAELAEFRRRVFYFFSIYAACFCAVCGLLFL